MAASHKASPSPRDIQILVQRPSPIKEIPVSKSDVTVDPILKTNDTRQSPDSTTIEPPSSDKPNTETVDTPVSLSKSFPPENPLADPDVRKAREVETHRIRPISGPAVFSVSPTSSEFEAVRKTRSVTDNLDDAPASPAFSALNSGPLKHGSSISQAPGSDSKGARRLFSSVSFDRLRMDKRKLDSSPGQEVGVQQDHGSEAGVAQLPRGAHVMTTAGQRLSELRSRHTSGFDTPMSFFESTSIASTGEAGEWRFVQVFFAFRQKLGYKILWLMFDI
jgi:hypothetical protein